eukprot:1146914-Pelagomonas_calceolata.AAC.30
MHTTNSSCTSQEPIELFPCGALPTLPYFCPSFIYPLQPPHLEGSHRGVALRGAVHPGGLFAHHREARLQRSKAAGRQTRAACDQRV